MHKKINENNKGFSLVELVIVVAVIAVIALLISLQYLEYVENSRQTNDLQTATHILRGLTTSIVDPKNGVLAGYVIEVVWYTSAPVDEEHLYGRFYVKPPSPFRSSVFTDSGIPPMTRDHEITDEITYDIMETLSDQTKTDEAFGLYGDIGEAQSKLAKEASLVIHIDSTTGRMALARHIDSDYDGDVNIWYDRFGLDIIEAPRPEQDMIHVQELPGQEPGQEQEPETQQELEQEQEIEQE